MSVFESLFDKVEGIQVTATQMLSREYHKIFEDNFSALWVINTKNYFPFFDKTTSIYKKHFVQKKTITLWRRVQSDTIFKTQRKSIFNKILSLLLMKSSLINFFDCAMKWKCKFLFLLLVKMTNLKNQAAKSALIPSHVICDLVKWKNIEANQ